MATFSTQFLTGGSANGTGILVAETTSPGTTIHTVTDTDEIELYATNNDTVERWVTIEYGSATATISITVTIPSKEGFTYIIPNLRLGNGLVIKAYAEVTNKIVLFGTVNRIS